MTRLHVFGTDGVRIAATRTGAGSPVVLVHGSGGGLDSWAPVAPFLQNDFELWTYARRGYSPSDGGTRPKSYADDVGDLSAVLEACGDPPHLVGASVGAIVALHHCLATPGRVLSLTLFEPPLFAAGAALQPVLDEHRRLVEQRLITTASWLFATAVARAPRSLVGARPRDEAPTTDPDTIASAEAHTADLEAMVADDPEAARWSGVEVPTLLLQGSQTWDPMPATMNALAVPSRSHRDGSRWKARRTSLRTRHQRLSPAPFGRSWRIIERMDASTAAGPDPVEPASGPQRPRPIAGELVTTRFAYDGGRRVTVYVPPDPPQAVVFAGDGQLISQWGGCLEDAGQRTTMIVGAYRTDDADEMVRIEEYSPSFDEERFAAHEKFFVDDVRGWVRSELGVALAPERTAVCGVSASAEFSLAMGLRHPELYGAVFASSPGGGYRPPSVLPGPLPRTYLTAGTSEPFFLENAVRWADALRAGGADVVMTERPGDHGDPFWEAEFPLMVAWAFPR